LLQALQHDLVALIHMGAAKAADITRAGIVSLLLLCRRRRSHQNERQN
jgi:hypothetical protein